MKFHPTPSLLAMLSFVLIQAGCDRTSPPPTTMPAGDQASTRAPRPRVPPEFKTDPTGKTIPMGEMLATARQQGANLPPGHPPIASTQPGTSSSLPAGHPPIGGMPAGHPEIGSANQPFDDSSPPEKMLDLKIPSEWSKKATRPMTVAIYALPKAEGSEDAELAVSHYPGMKNVPLDMQVQRWAGQFKQPDGKSTADVLKKSKLENAGHPTTLIDITGQYTASSMMSGATGAPKDNYEMLVGYMETDQGPWFFKLVGPQATVAAHREEFLKVLREAK